MDKKRLIAALFDLRKRLVNSDGERSQDMRDAEECVAVVFRVLEGKTIEKALGAPGDWGYENPIGKALAARPPTATPAFRENDCSGTFDGTRVVSDADPGL